MKMTARLRELLGRDEILVAPGAYDALSARLVQSLGFDAVYMTGAGTTVARAGLPDISLITQTEMVDNARYMADALDVPLICDADTGYGNAVNVLRTVRLYERAGVAAIHIEDQVLPKRCGHVAGKEVIPPEEAAGKIAAACAARSDPDFVIIARVDARSVNGFDDAVRRGQLYREAGADVVFPEALESREEFAEYARRVDAPLLANMTEFGKSPLLSTADLHALGYRLVIFPATTLRVAMKAMAAFLTDLKRTGTQAHWLDRMQTRRELYDLVEYDRYTMWETKFAGRE